MIGKFGFLSLMTPTLDSTLLNIYITVFALCLVFLHKSNSVASFIYDWVLPWAIFDVPQMYTF